MCMWFDTYLCVTDVEKERGDTRLAEHDWATKCAGCHEACGWGHDCHRLAGDVSLHLLFFRLSSLLCDLLCCNMSEWSAAKTSSLWLCVFLVCWPQAITCNLLFHHNLLPTSPRPCMPLPLPPPPSRPRPTSHFSHYPCKNLHACCHTHTYACMPAYTHHTHACIHTPHTCMHTHTTHMHAYTHHTHACIHTSHMHAYTHHAHTCMNAYTHHTHAWMHTHTTHTCIRTHITHMHASIHT